MDKRTSGCSWRCVRERGQERDSAKGAAGAALATFNVEAGDALPERAHRFAWRGVRGGYGERGAGFGEQ